MCACGRAGLQSSAGAAGLKGAAASKTWLPALARSWAWQGPSCPSGGGFSYSQGLRAQTQEGDDFRSRGQLGLWLARQSPVCEPAVRWGRPDPALLPRSTKDPTEHSAGLAVTPLCCQWAARGNLWSRDRRLSAAWDTCSQLIGKTPPEWETNPSKSQGLQRALGAAAGTELLQTFPTERPRPSVALRSHSKSNLVYGPTAKVCVCTYPGSCRNTSLLSVQSYSSLQNGINWQSKLLMEQTLAGAERFRKLFRLLTHPAPATFLPHTLRLCFRPNL